jgi:hypothetical protein
VTLRDEQLAQFEAVMRERGIDVSLAFDTGTVEPARQQAILRAYGSLLPLQRQTLRAGGAVSTAAMTLDARRRLRLALQAPGGGLADAAPATAQGSVLTLSRAPSATEDEGDSVAVDGDSGDASRAADRPAPRAENGELYGVVFRLLSQEGEVAAIAVMLPRVRSDGAGWPNTSLSGAHEAPLTGDRLEVGIP